VIRAETRKVAESTSSEVRTPNKATIAATRGEPDDLSELEGRERDRGTEHVEVPGEDVGVHRGAPR